MNTGLVIFLGIGIVFIGLICLVLICKSLGTIVRILEEKMPEEKPAAPAKPAPAPTVSAKKESTDAGPRGEVVAAIAAVLAEELGEDISAIRILSLKKI